MHRTCEGGLKWSRLVGVEVEVVSTSDVGVSTYRHGAPANHEGGKQPYQLEVYSYLYMRIYCDTAMYTPYTVAYCL